MTCNLLCLYFSNDLSTCSPLGLLAFGDEDSYAEVPGSSLTETDGWRRHLHHWKQAALLSPHCELARLFGSSPRPPPRNPSTSKTTTHKSCVVSTCCTTKNVYNGLVMDCMNNYSVSFRKWFKGIVHPKMKIVSFFTHLHVIPNLY